MSDSKPLQFTQCIVLSSKVAFGILRMTHVFFACKLTFVLYDVYFPLPSDLGTPVSIDLLR